MPSRNPSSSTTSRKRSNVRRPREEPILHSSDSARSAATIDEERLERIERMSRFLDEAFVIPGTNHRVGWDAIIGLIPGIGDVATAAMSAYVVREAAEMGVSKWTLARMVGNIAVDSVLGFVPLVGDLFDAGFKANTKNARLLRTHVERRSKRR